MANVNTGDIKRLREVTAAGMMDCKKALEEAAGDFDKAVEILRLKGAKDVGKREARTASNGLVAVHHDGEGLAALLELNCETDFVAKNQQFQLLAAKVARHLVASKPADVPTLLESSLAGEAVKEHLDEANAALGEKIEVRRFVVFQGEYVASYLHKTSPDLPPTVGVLVQLDVPNAEVSKDVAHHIAAMAPKYLSRDDVPADVVQTERRLAEQMAREEGKPEQALPKIIEGRVNGFFKDFVLVDQPFVKDNKKTVGKVVVAAGVTVRRFARFKVGQP